MIRIIYLQHKQPKRELVEFKYNPIKMMIKIIQIYHLIRANINIILYLLILLILLLLKKKTISEIVFLFFEI